MAEAVTILGDKIEDGNDMLIIGLVQEAAATLRFLAQNRQMGMADVIEDALANELGKHKGPCIAKLRRNN